MSVLCLRVGLGHVAAGGAIFPSTYPLFNLNASFRRKFKLLPSGNHIFINRLNYVSVMTQNMLCLHRAVFKYFSKLAKEMPY